MRILHRTMLASAAIALVSYATMGVASAADHPDRFVASSPDFKDNGMMSMAMGAEGHSVRGPWQCGGKNISPAISWSHEPKDTKSFAVLMDDIDAASGRGGTHWILYDIPANIHALPRNMNAHPERFVGGNIGEEKGAAYHGPCAEPGAKMHHFYYYVYALDVPPGTLPKGLNRADFAKAMQGHNTAEASLVARFYHPVEKKPEGKLMSQR
jgi:Raf kinase inhibitor-like YbhB/YbcL family protein